MMAKSEKRAASMQPPFDAAHPVIPAAYAVIALVLTMMAFQPVLIGIALIASICFQCLLGGARRLGRSLLWLVPIMVVIVVLNPLIAPAGSTALFVLGTLTVYLEGVAYGACMAALLLAVVTEFSGASQVMTTDKLMALTGRTMPIVALMLSQVNRLIVRFMRQGRQIESVQSACTAAHVSRTRRISAHARVVSVLVGWSLEDSLETADAMRARGWGSAARRSSYRRYRFTRHDALALGFVFALGSLCAYVAIASTVGFRVYPVMTSLGFWWGYVPYALFFFLPSMILVGERK